MLNDMLWGYLVTSDLHLQDQIGKITPKIIILIVLGHGVRDDLDFFIGLLKWLKPMSKRAKVGSEKHV